MQYRFNVLTLQKQTNCSYKSDWQTEIRYTKGTKFEKILMLFYFLLTYVSR